MVRLPLVGAAPDHAPVLLQVVAVVTFQDSVDTVPAGTVAGEAVIVIAGGG